MITQLCAASLPRTVLLFAGLFSAVLAGWLLHQKRINYPFVICLASALSAGMFLVQSGLAMRPVTKYAGSEHQLRAKVEEVRPGYAEGMVYARLRVQQVDGRKTNFWVVCPELPDSIPGEIVQGPFLLEEVPDNGRRLSLYSNRVFLQAELTGEMHWSEGEMGLSGRLFALRTQLARNVSRYIPKPFGGLLAAMTIGIKDGLEQKIQQQFRTAGLAHLLVVSGLHLSMLCGAFLPQKLFAGWLQRVRGILALFLVLAMMALTGFSPSICRAGIAAIIYHVGLIFFLPADPLTSLGLSAFLLCAGNCYAACDVGLQLSYSATLGVLFAVETLARGKKLPQWKSLSPLFQKILGGAAGLLAPSFFAAVFTLPVQLWHQMQISGTTMLANILALWLVRPLLICGMGCAVLGFVPQLMFLYRAVSLAGAVLTRLLAGIARFCADLPFSQLALPREYAIFVWLILVLFGLLLWKNHKMRWMWLAAPCFVLAAACCTGVLARNVVYITLAGSRMTPCMIVAQNDRAVVLYQGRSSNAQAVEETLERMGEPELSLLVDFRQDAKPLPLAAKKTILVESLSVDSVKEDTLGTIHLSMLRQSQGSLAVVEIAGHRIAFCAGEIHLAQPCQVDLLVASKKLPTEILPQNILLTSDRYAWLEEPPATTLLYAEETPWIRLRPGHSCQYFEVKHVTHT